MEDEVKNEVKAEVNVEVKVAPQRPKMEHLAIRQPTFKRFNELKGKGSADELINTMMKIYSAYFAKKAEREQTNRGVK